MNRYIFSLLLILSTASARTLACPTCVAKVQPNSPPFFVDEFYIFSDEAFETDLVTTSS
jgi:hypothetical protein